MQLSRHGGTMLAMLQLTTVLGNIDDATLAARLHHVEHHGGVEIVRIAPPDVGRHRLRITSDKGTDCAIALPRAARLTDGAILLLEHQRAIVVRIGAQAWLRVQPLDTAAALELGHQAGNLHWKVRFEGAQIAVALDAPRDNYIARLQHLLDRGRIRLIDADPPAVS